MDPACGPIESLIRRLPGERRQAPISLGDRFVVVRAQCGEGGRSVVLKAVRSDRREPRNEELLRHEWEVLRRLDLRGVVHPIELVEGDAGPVLVLVDAGPCDLSAYLNGRPLDTPQFFELATAMAETLGELHRRGFLHRDVCPMNFVIGERPVLVDFETATSMPAFVEGPAAVGKLEGTLTYIAPGRMNRRVDCRADLYALGATFYEMLTGAPPFPSRDPLELVHAHLARCPPAPAVVNESVPRGLSDIVVKLLSKMPEWRYQTAHALRLDLEEAARRWRRAGEVPSFELGRHDVPYGLLLGGKLYGREHATEELERVVDRIGAGRAELVVVSGAAGIGKSALVHEVRDLTRSRCRWLEGKGDLLQGNVPYVPVLEAFRDLLRRSMHLPAERVEALGHTLRAAISPNGRVLTEMLPELHALIGDQREVPEVGPVEAENRFQHAFVSFVRALGEESTPIALFLDDVQWADPASMKLVTTILSEPDLRAVLVVAAYRSEELGPDHPLRQAIASIRASGTAVSTLELGPLERRSIAQLLCDALRLDPPRAEPLADAIAKKTGGNPFFILHFLGHLHRAGFLAYDAFNGEWSWDIARIEHADVTENVVDLLSRRIGMLPAPEQEVLSTAACIGNEFDLGVLAGVRSQTLEQLAETLRGPLEAGLVAPATRGPRFSWAATKPIELGTANAPTYRFAHDRVQEAAYKLLGDAARKDLHLAIGRWLLANIPDQGFENAIGSIVDQFDRAAENLRGEERTKIAELNYRAGRLARSATAYTSALGYFGSGLELLPPEPWDSPAHELWFRLVRDAAESAALTGEHALCERLIEAAGERTRVRLEKAALTELLVQSNALRGAHAEAIRHGRAGLALLGVDLPRDVHDASVAIERKRVQDTLRGRTDQELVGAPPIEDAESRMRLEHLVSLAAATWFVAPDLFRIVSFRAVDLTVRRGSAPGSSFSFAAYAIALAMEGEYEDAYRFGRLAVRLAERVANAAEECRALVVFAGHVSPWRASVRESIPLLRRARGRGVESGELEYAAYAVANLLFARWFRGAKLDTILDETHATLEFYRRIGHAGGIDYVVPFAQAARCLKGLTRNRARFDDERFDERTFLAAASENGLAMAVYHLLRLEACYWLDEPAMALEHARASERWLPFLRTLFFQANHFFYTALTLASLCDQAPSPLERQRFVSELERHRSRLEEWARQSPATFGHKHDLVAAEMARVEGRPDVSELYERAIAGAEREGCLHEEALAHERFARILHSEGDDGTFERHSRAAIDRYAAWGATAKRALVAGDFASIGQASQVPAVDVPFSPGSLPTLDLRILLHAAEALTSELLFDRLLQKLMRICVEAASAERAALVMYEKGPVLRALATANGEVTLESTPLAGGASVPAGVIEHVRRHGEVVAEDAAHDPRFSRDPYIVRAAVRSALAVPLRRQDRTVGVLYFENNLATGAFTPDRIKLFRLLSAQMAVALENSLLFEQGRRGERELKILSDASVELSESPGYDEVLRTIGALVVPALADFCLVDVLDGLELRPAGERHADAAKTGLLEELHRGLDRNSLEPQATAVRSRKPQLVSVVTNDSLRAGAPDERRLLLLEALQPRSLMAVPLVAHGRAIGVLTLVRTRADGRYESAELRLAEELAHRAALALDNARLHQELEEEIRRKNDRDSHLRTIFRQVPGAIWATDRSLRLTYVAGQLRNAVDLDARELVGSTVYDLFGTRDPTQAGVARHLAALAGEAQSFRIPYRARWYEVLIEPLRAREQQIVGCVGAAFDITERRATEERLARNEARLAEAQRVAHIGSFEWEIAPNVVTWSDELNRIYGIEPGHFPDTFEAFLARVHPEDLETTRDVVFRALRQGQAFRYDHRVVRSDGSVRVLHTRGDFVKSPEGKPLRMVGTCWDVTELSEATAARERSLSLLHATVEATADGILVVDRTGKVVLTNQQFRSLWKLSPERGEPLDEESMLDAVLQQVDDPDGFRAVVLYLQARPDTESLDVVRLHDGRVFERHSGPQRVGDAVVGRVWSYRDISERERLLKRAVFLSDATRLLASLDAERALDAVAHLAVPYLGESCAVDLFGGPEPRRLLALSRNPGSIIPPEVHPSVRAGQPVIYGAASTSYLGVPLVATGGIVGAMTFSAAPGGRYTQRDLELAEELGRRAALGIDNARLYQQARDALRARDEFLIIAAHEVRGPLTSLHLAVQMLKRGKLSRDFQPKAFDIIEREAARLARFVDELLDLSRIREGALTFAFEDVNLGQVVQDVATQLGPDLIRAGSSLSVAAESQVRGDWDRLRLEQVVSNLLLNAIKFGLGKPISVSVSSRDRVAILSVRDRGIGIAPEMQDRIFKPFERGVSVRHFGGLGLGLYIVKNIAESLGGSVRVDSRLGGGATFIVELPMTRRT
jgi:PAS domain S-box-containing protein